MLYYGEDDRTLTFAEFNTAKKRIARFSKSMSIVNCYRIPAYLSNPFVASIAMIGVWKAGAVFSPINFGHKARLLSHQINDAVP